MYKNKQAISACEQALCQLTVCFEFQRRSEERKGHKMKNIFEENTVNAIDIKLQLISSTVKILKYFCSAMQ